MAEDEASDSIIALGLSGSKANDGKLLFQINELTGIIYFLPKLYSPTTLYLMTALFIIKNYICGGGGGVRLIKDHLHYTSLVRSECVTELK